MDEADIANAQSEKMLLAHLRFRKKEGPASTGFCLFCGNALSNNRRWCDADCRDDYQKERLC